VLAVTAAHAWGTEPDKGLVSVELPPATEQFPPGKGAVIANSQCLICHSADMVLRQPKFTPAQWEGTINKMRAAYGAPIAPDQIAPLATYLSQLRPGE
jgi:mono/diheme cytochrome c family protein